MRSKNKLKSVLQSNIICLLILLGMNSNKKNQKINIRVLLTLSCAVSCNFDYHENVANDNFTKGLINIKIGITWHSSV